MENKVLRSAKDIAMEKANKMDNQKPENAEPKTVEDKVLRSAKDIAMEKAGKMGNDKTKTAESEAAEDKPLRSANETTVEKTEIDVKKGQHDRTETATPQGEGEKHIDKAIQDILDAEDNLKKREKSHNRFSEIVFGFKSVFEKKKEVSPEEKAQVTKEKEEAVKKLSEAKNKLDDLIKKRAEEDHEKGKAGKELIDEMMDAKMKLVNARIERETEQMPNTVKKLKKTMDWWHEQKWYTQVGLTACLILGGGELAAAGGIATVAGVLMMGGGTMLDALGATAGVESMVGSFQKKSRVKKGLTKEAKAEETKTALTEEINKEKDQGRFNDFLKKFDTYDKKLDGELDKVFKIENKQNRNKWILAIAAGMTVGAIGVSRAMAKGAEGIAEGTKAGGRTGFVHPEVRAMDEEKLANIVEGGAETRISEKMVQSMSEDLARAEKLSQNIGQGAEKSMEVAARSTERTLESLESLAGQVTGSPDKFKSVIEAGSSQWKTAENFLSKGNVLGFNTMNEAQKTHLIDSVLTKIGKTDMVKPGDVMDFGKFFENSKALETVMESNKGIVAGSKKFLNIMENNAAIEKLTVANQGKSIIDKTAKAGETFATSLDKVPTSVKVAKEATFNAIKEIGVSVKNLPEFAGESGVWARTSDMSVYKFMEESAKKTIQMREKVGGTTNVFTKRAMNGNEEKAINFMRDYITKIGDIFRNPKKGETVMQYINEFRKANGAASYNKFGVPVMKEGLTKVKPVLAGPL